MGTAKEAGTGAGQPPCGVLTNCPVLSKLTGSGDGSWTSHFRIKYVCLKMSPRFLPGIRLAPNSGTQRRVTDTTQEVKDMHPYEQMMGKIFPA